MRVCRLAVTLLLLSPASWAHARTSPGIPGRLVRGLDGAWQRTGAASERVAAEAARPARQDAVTAAAPLPFGAVQIDSTYYDLQDMGSLGTRIVVGSDNRVHVAYEKDYCELEPTGCPPDPDDPRVAPRGMGYAYRSAGGTWNRLGKVVDPDIRNCCTTELHGGFGTLAVTPTGRAAVAQHMNEDGCDLRADMYLEDAAGGSTWGAYLTPFSDFLFPQVVALPNGSFTLLGEIPLSPPASFYEEVGEFQINRLNAAGAPFVCPLGWQFGSWSSVVAGSLFKGGFPAFPSMAASSNGKVGIAVGDFGGDMRLIESSNGTFGAGTITIRNLTNYSDAAITVGDSTSAQYRPYIHCHLAYNDTTPHVVWSELQARRIGGTIEYFDHRSRIRHWSSTAGVSTVKQVLAGEADRYDDLDLGLAGPMSGFNTISVDWPQVGFSDDGQWTHVAWLRFVDTEIDPTADAGFPGVITGCGFGDIAMSARIGNGSWSPPANLTATPTTDERFFSLAARNPGGKTHIVFQASATNQAGVALIGDRGTAPGPILRRIAYLERPSLVDVPAAPPVARGTLRAFPTPAPSGVRLAWSGAADRAITVEIYSVSGRHVASVDVGPGFDAEWDGRDRTGARVPAGVYWARVAGDPATRPAKLLMLR